MFWKWMIVIVFLSLTAEEVSAGAFDDNAFDEFGYNNETWCCDTGYCCEDKNRACCGSVGHETCCTEGYQCCIGQCVVPTCECCDDGCYPPGFQCCEEGGACEAGNVCCIAGCCEAGSTCCDDWGCCGVGFSCCGLGCCEDTDDPFFVAHRTTTKPRMYL